jgi:DNA-binding response OmpR family regulator
MDIETNSNQPAGEKLSVLVVDDDARILKFVAASLRLFGYNVMTAETGEDALKLAASRKIDVMVLDLLMPLISGFDVLKQLRAASSVPVLVVSAHFAAADKALNLGASDFLEKPFMPEELLKRIQALTNRRA